MKRTARPVKDPNGNRRVYELTPDLSGIKRVSVDTKDLAVVSGYPFCETLLCTWEKLSDAEALARIGYTLEKPKPVLELGEETALPKENNKYYLLQSDESNGIVRVGVGGLVYDHNGNVFSSLDLTNARFWLVTVKEPQP